VRWSKLRQRVESRIAPSLAGRVREQFIDALEAFLQLPIEKCLSSGDAVVRAMVFLDARLGERRLAGFNVDLLPTEIERACLRARIDAEELSG
jgi:hypothetical protein